MLHPDFVVLRLGFAVPLLLFACLAACSSVSGDTFASQAQAVADVSPERLLTVDGRSTGIGFAADDDHVYIAHQQSSGTSEVWRSPVWTWEPLRPWGSGVALELAYTTAAGDALLTYLDPEFFRCTVSAEGPDCAQIGRVMTLEGEPPAALVSATAPLVLGTSSFVYRAHPKDLYDAALDEWLDARAMSAYFLGEQGTEEHVLFESPFSIFQKTCGKSHPDGDHIRYLAEAVHGSSLFVAIACESGGVYVVEKPAYRSYQGDVQVLLHLEGFEGVGRLHVDDDHIYFTSSRPEEMGCQRWSATFSLFRADRRALERDPELLAAHLPVRSGDEIQFSRSHVCWSSETEQRSVLFACMDKQADEAAAARLVGLGVPHRMLIWSLAGNAVYWAHDDAGHTEVWRLAIPPSAALHP